LGDDIAVGLTECAGSFAPERESVRLEPRGVSTRPENVSVNGEEANGRITVRLAESAEETTEEVRF